MSPKPFEHPMVRIIFSVFGLTRSMFGDGKSVPEVNHKNEQQGLG